MKQTSLFLDGLSYPAQVAGHKGTATSREAAKKSTPGRKAVYGLIENILREEELTADVIAKRIGRGLLYIRPRCSEMKLLGLIQPTGETRKNETGRNADVFRLTK